MKVQVAREEGERQEEQIRLDVPDGAGRFEGILQEVLSGFRRFGLLSACLRLDLFGRLRREKSLEELQEELGARADLLFLLLENLAGMGVVEKTQRGYRLSPWVQAFLDRDSPFCQLRRLGHELRRALRWLELDRLIKGEVIHDRERFFSEAVHALAEERLLGDIGEVLDVLCGLEEFRGVKKVLDLGGGHGLFAIAFTKAKGDLEAWVFDLPRVLEEAGEYIRRYGARRVHLLPGDFFRDDLGTGYDLVFSAYNPGGKRAELIPKIWRALKVGGLYVNLQFFPKPGDYDEEDLDWNLWSFGMPKGLKAYSFKGDLGLDAYIRLLEGSGFFILKILEMRRGSMMILAKKGRGA